MNTNHRNRKKAGKKAGRGRPFLQEGTIRELMARYAEGEGETLRSLAIEVNVSAASLSTRFKRIRENGKGSREELEERVKELEKQLAQLWKILQNHTLEPILRVGEGDRA